MTNLRIKWALFVFTVLLFGWYLLPTIRFYQLPSNNPNAIESPAPTETTGTLGSIPNPNNPPSLTTNPPPGLTPATPGEIPGQNGIEIASGAHWRGSLDPGVTKLRENAMKLGLDLQ